MYGTIARMRLKPGKEADMQRWADENAMNPIPGLVFQHVYRMDNNANEFFVVVGFESKEAYQANANSPEQHQRYLQYREMLDAEPEWHDGEIVTSMAE